MSKIISIGTAVPASVHKQADVGRFLEKIYALPDADRRKLDYLSAHSGIATRYSVIPDYSLPTAAWEFYPPTENLEPFPTIEQRMDWYGAHAAPLSQMAIQRCMTGQGPLEAITHLITVSCTGLSAPGLDLELVQLLGLAPTVFRTSVNFMGCYAAIHALKLADALAVAPGARVLVVCTELCTLHFQRGGTMDNILSGLLFADGSAAALVVNDAVAGKGLHIDDFYSRIIPEGKKDMAWELSQTGFKMVLSGYVPELIEADFAGIINDALTKKQLQQNDISHWCIHPGGKRILDTICKSLRMENTALDHSYAILREYGNMSSATILFVLQRIMAELDYSKPDRVMGAAFGPGLTMETFMGSSLS